MEIPPHALRRVACTALLVWAAGAAARGEPAQPPLILVRLRAEGPHAVTACAETQFRQRTGLARATRDGSDSLDRLHAELGVQEMRALYRRPDGRPFDVQRAALRAPALRRRQGLDVRLRASLPAMPELAHVYRLQLPSGADASAAAARYASDAHVIWAQPNFPVALDVAADDPFLASSGSWGQPFADLWGIQRVRAPAAWEYSQGGGVVVAVVDTGVDTEHPDLAANVWVNPGEDLDGNGRADPEDQNGLDDDANGFVDDLHGFDFANSLDANGDGDFDDPGDVSDANPFDDNGHGTHVAGTAAAVANNGIGVAGVAPRARIMALKGFRESGESPIEVLARGMVYAVLNGARVINTSWSCSARCPSNPVAEDAVAFAASMGVVVVDSAGNRADDVVFYSPENRRETIVVGATGVGDEPMFFTNFGFLVDVMAPGGANLVEPGDVPQRAILSTRSAGANFAADGGGRFTAGGEYLRWDGTSMSTPHVAGIAALILATRPELSVDEVRAVIRRSARDLGGPGSDRSTGHGLADAARAVLTDPPSVRAVFAAPAPGAILVPGDTPLTIRGTLDGDVISAELSVGFGTDPARFDPIPLASPSAIAQGELAYWDVSALADGPYLLRLEVRGADDSRVDEFLPLSLERNPPTRLSSPGPDASAPAISGSLVAWESRRPLEDEERGLELFVHDWRSGVEWRAVSAPGDQRAARLSEARLAWFDAREHPSEIRTCRLDHATPLGVGSSERLHDPEGPCREKLVAGGPERRGELVVSGDQLIWTESGAANDRLRGCIWRGGRCRELALPASQARQSEPILSGSRLSWKDWSGVVGRLLTCSGFPSVCEPRLVQDAAAPDRIAASGPLFAWTQFSVDVPLFVCRLEADGACPPLQIALLGADPNPAVSDGRVTWNAPGAGGDSDIFFCEYDRHTGRCPVQQITGSAAEQRRPAIAGTRVVWEDNRDGAVGVFGLELPSLAPLADRSTRVGRPLRIFVRGRDPSGAVLALSANFADDTPLAERDAQFRERGDGSAVLHWTPSAADLGAHIVTFVGRAAGGLTTRRSVQIAVAP